jgi:hypothetical protein
MEHMSPSLAERLDDTAARVSSGEPGDQRPGLLCMIPPSAKMVVAVM